MTRHTLPRADTLTARALMRLVIGRRITHRDFQRETASYRLSSYIESLRHRHGFDEILTKNECAPTSDPTGRRATYGRYWMEPEALQAIRDELGERLQLFVEGVQRFEAGAGGAQ